MSMSMNMTMPHNHSMGTNSSMNHTGMNHTGMNHTGMNHTGMNHTDHGMDHTMHGMNNHQMQMYFVFSSTATILFEEWDIDSTKGMVWSCVVVFLMAVLYEGFKVFREIVRENYIASHQASNVNNHVAGGKEIGFAQTKGSFCNWHHFLQSFLHIIQVAVSYFLMLIAMTFNGWLFISVCVGAGVGYFLFSWRVSRAFDVNEHCH